MPTDACWLASTQEPRHRRVYKEGRWCANSYLTTLITETGPVSEIDARKYSFWIKYSLLQMEESVTWLKSEIIPSLEKVPSARGITSFTLLIPISFVPIRWIISTLKIYKTTGIKAAFLWKMLINSVTKFQLFVQMTVSRNNLRGHVLKKHNWFGMRKCFFLVAQRMRKYLCWVFCRFYWRYRLWERFKSLE